MVFLLFLPRNLHVTKNIYSVFKMRKLFLLLTLFSFIYCSSQSVTIIQPNGGEILYACQTYTVTWSQTGAPSNYWNIDYSLDGGTIWTSVTSNYLSTNGQFVWTVPNVQSNTVLIRVRDAQNTNTADQSNNFFTINIPVILTSPNGGEVWQGNTTQNITWNAIGTSNSYTIQYSTNGGTTWTNIVTNYSTTTGTYAWAIPAMPTSTNCLVRVMDYVQNCMQDVSNSVFTINAAQPILLTPNGGESLSSQCSYNITWNTATFYTNVLLEYSTNNGSTWTTIGTYTNNGTRAWTVPNIGSNQCLVRISNSGLPTLTDVSNATFTINNPITVTAANGGETWYGCSTYNITWNASTCIGTFTILYSTNNGSTWTTITSLSNTSTYNTGNTNQSYAWIVPNGITSTQCLIKVQDANNPTTVFDVSNANFTINPSNDITVTSPNGGENWQGLSTQTITWANLPAASGQYNVLYSTNGGASYTTIVSNITGNSYNWSVPNINNTTVRIKVVDAVNTCKEDASDNNFTISPAQPILLTPNGGEMLYSGTTYNITWNTATLYTNVLLEYSTNNGSTWTTIGTYTNNGTRAWTVPNANSTQCLVRISNSGYPAVSDVSNNVFTIKPAVTVITPNGDNGVTIWGGCTVTSITFDRSPAWTSYNFEYSVNNGSTWVTIATNWTTTANPATYNWNIPNIPTTQALVRVTPVSTTYSDQSDATFTITKPVTIIQPNFGGIMQVGSTYTISWSSDGISNIYDIFYSTNGGTSFTNIVMGYNTSTNTYNWLVPNIPSTNCKIMVRDNINNCKSDTSDVPFTISTTAPAITLTSPNGISDTLTGCFTKTITWNDSPTIGTYDLAYSLNSGSTWINIATNYATTTHSYNWVVPNNINSNQVLLRVRSTANPTTTFDLSDAFFNIKPGNLIAIPTATSVCSGTPVQLSATGGYNYNWTPSNGLSASNISNPIATPTATTTYYVQSINGSCVLSDTVIISVTTGTTTASVGISASSTSICSGTNVTFTATPTNGGTAPTFQWKVNGINVGTNSSTYSSASLNNNDVVTCVLNSNLPCVSGSPSTSSPITITVNPVVTPSVALNASPGSPICAGTSVTFSASPSNGGSSPSYQWKINGNNIGGNTSTFTNSALSNGDVVSVIMTSNLSCVTTTSATTSTSPIVVNNVPSQPSAITGNLNICSGSSQSYSVSAVSGATSYIWTIPSGWSGSSTTNTINVVPMTSGGVISVVANNSCGASLPQSITTNVNTTPATPQPISGNSSACLPSSETFSVTPVSGATSYTWNFPSGWTGSSSTNSINLVLGSLSGNVSVTANNSCGSSVAQTFSVVVNTVPNITSSMSGPVTLCAGSNATYSVTPVSGSTNYSWSMPQGWSGNSSTNTIAAIAGSNSGTISVTASNMCGTSAPQTLTVATNSIPQTPAAISGTNSICSASTTTYSVSVVNGATAYQWTLPTGWTGSSVINTINTTAGSSSGTIQVAATNSCGASAPQSLSVTTNDVPSTPGIISGSTVICENSSTTYSISPVVNATSYNWTIPNGWTGNSTSNIITAVSGTSGTIGVSAVNTCGSSASNTIVVNVTSIPAIPIEIIGDTLVCENSNTAYSVANYGTGFTYNWTIPSGWAGNSFSDSAIVTIGNNGGTIAVSVSNSCGTSPAQTITVTVTTMPAQPNGITGNNSVCENSVNSYSVSPVSGASSYNWSLPNGWIGSSVSNNIILTAGNASGIVSVTATNGCGTSTPQTLSVIANALPAVSVDFSSIDTQCVSSAAVVLNGGLPIGGIYSGPGVTGTTFDPAISGAGLFSINYSFTDTNSCTSSVSDNIYVDVCAGSVDVLSENKFNIYPNPFSSIATIMISNSITLNETEVHITDATGKLIMKLTNLNNREVKINANDFSSGVYFYKIISQKNFIHSGKMIIEK